MKRPVLFEHIPKTAGSTVNNILHRHYHRVFAVESLRSLQSIEGFQRRPEGQRARLQLVRGHGASLLRDTLDNPYVFTFLRHPMERMLSQYNYIRSRSDHRSSEVSRRLSFDDYLDHAIEHGEDNLQTRFLSSLLTDALKQLATPVERSHLREATRQLASFDRVFFADSFDVALLHLKSDLGWKEWPCYVRQNVSSGMSMEDLNVNTREKLVYTERFDMELYQWAREGLFTSVAKPRIEAFQKRNATFASSRLLRMRHSALSKIRQWVQ